MIEFTIDFTIDFTTDKLAIVPNTLYRRNNIIINFQNWLNEQQDRDDLIGELARLPQMQNVEHKETRPKKNEHKNWVDVVITIADPSHRDAFNDAWQEYILYREKVEGALG